MEIALLSILVGLVIWFTVMSLYLLKSIQMEIKEIGGLLWRLLGICETIRSNTSR